MSRELFTTIDQLLKQRKETTSLVTIAVLEIALKLATARDVHRSNADALRQAIAESTDALRELALTLNEEMREALAQWHATFPADGHGSRRGN